MNTKNNPPNRYTPEDNATRRQFGGIFGLSETTPEKDLLIVFLERKYCKNGELHYTYTINDCENLDVIEAKIHNRAIYEILDNSEISHISIVLSDMSTKIGHPSNDVYSYSLISANRKPVEQSFLSKKELLDFKVDERDLPDIDYRLETTDIDERDTFAQSDIIDNEKDTAEIPLASIPVEREITDEDWVSTPEDAEAEALEQEKSLERERINAQLAAEEEAEQLKNSLEEVEEITKTSDYEFADEEEEDNRNTKKGKKRTGVSGRIDKSHLGVPTEMRIDGGATPVPPIVPEAQESPLPFVEDLSNNTSFSNTQPSGASPEGNSAISKDNYRERQSDDYLKRETAGETTQREKIGENTNAKSYLSSEGVENASDKVHKKNNAPIEENSPKAQGDISSHGTAYVGDIKTENISERIPVDSSLQVKVSVQSTPTQENEVEPTQTSSKTELTQTYKDISNSNLSQTPQESAPHSIKNEVNVAVETIKKGNNVSPNVDSNVKVMQNDTLKTGERVEPTNVSSPTYSDRLFKESIDKTLNSTVTARNVDVVQTATSIIVTLHDNGNHTEAIINKTTGDVSSSSEALRGIVSSHYNTFTPAPVYTDEEFTDLSRTNNETPKQIRANNIPNATSFEGQRTPIVTQYDLKVEDLNDFIKRSENNLPILYQDNSQSNRYYATFGSNTVYFGFDEKTHKIVPSPATLTSDINPTSFVSPYGSSITNNVDVQQYTQTLNRYVDSLYTAKEARLMLANKASTGPVSLVSHGYLENGVPEQTMRIGNGTMLPMRNFLVEANRVGSSNFYSPYSANRVQSVQNPLNPYLTNVSNSSFAENLRSAYLNSFRKMPPVNAIVGNSADIANIEDIIMIAKQPTTPTFNSDNFDIADNVGEIIDGRGFSPVGTSTQVANDGAPRSHRAGENQPYNFFSPINPNMNLTPYKTIKANEWKQIAMPFAYSTLFKLRNVVKNSGEMGETVEKTAIYASSVISIFKPPTAVSQGYDVAKYANSFIGSLPSTNLFRTQLSELGLSDVVINNLKDAQKYVALVDQRATNLQLNIQELQLSSPIAINDKINELKEILKNDKTLSSDRINLLNDQISTLEAMKTGRKFGTTPQQLTEIYKEKFTQLGVNTDKLTNILNKKQAQEFVFNIRSLFQGYGIEDVFSLSAAQINEILESGRISDAKHLELFNAITQKEFKTFFKNVVRRGGLKSRLQSFVMILARTTQDIDAIQGGLLTYRMLVTVKATIKTAHRILKVVKRISRKLAKKTGLDIATKKVATRFINNTVVGKRLSKGYKVTRTGIQTARKVATTSKVGQGVGRATQIVRQARLRKQALFGKMRNAILSSFGKTGATIGAGAGTATATTATTATATATTAAGTAGAAVGGAGATISGGWLVVLIIAIVIVAVMLVWLGGMMISKFGMPFNSTMDSIVEEKTIETVYSDCLNNDYAILNNAISAKVSDKELNNGSWIEDNADGKNFGEINGISSTQSYNNLGYYDPTKEKTNEITSWGWGFSEEDNKEGNVYSHTLIPKAGEGKTFLGEIYDKKTETHNLGRDSMFCDSPKSIYYKVDVGGNTILKEVDNPDSKEISYTSNAREIISCANALILDTHDSELQFLNSNVPLFKGYATKGLYYDLSFKDADNKKITTRQAASLWTATHGVQTNASSLYSCNGCKTLDCYYCNDSEWDVLTQKRNNAETKNRFVFNNDTTGKSENKINYNKTLPYSSKGCYQHLDGSKAITYDGDYYSNANLRNYGNLTNAQIKKALYNSCGKYHKNILGNYELCDGSTHTTQVKKIYTKDEDCLDKDKYCKSFTGIRKSGDTITKTVDCYDKVKSEFSHYCSWGNSLSSECLQASISASKNITLPVYLVPMKVENNTLIIGSKKDQKVIKNAECVVLLSIVTITDTKTKTEFTYAVYTCMGHCFDCNHSNADYLDYSSETKFNTKMTGELRRGTAKGSVVFSYPDGSTAVESFSLSGIYYYMPQYCDTCEYYKETTTTVSMPIYEAYGCNGHCDGHGPQKDGSEHHCVYCTGHRDLIYSAYIISGTSPEIINNRYLDSNYKLQTINETTPLSNVFTAIQEVNVNNGVTIKVKWDGEKLVYYDATAPNQCSKSQYVSSVNLPFNSIFFADSIAGPVSILNRTADDNVIKDYADTFDKATRDFVLYGGKSSWYHLRNGGVISDNPLSIANSKEHKEAIAEASYFRSLVNSKATTDWVYLYGTTKLDATEDLAVSGDNEFIDFLYDVTKSEYEFFDQMFVRSEDVDGVIELLPSSTSDARKQFLRYTLSSIGKIPYYKNTSNSDIALYYNDNGFGNKLSDDISDEGNRRLSGLNPKQWIMWSYKSAFTEDGKENPYVPDKYKAGLKTMFKDTDTIGWKFDKVKSSMYKGSFNALYETESIKPGDILNINGELVIFIDYLNENTFCGVTMATSEFTENVVAKYYDCKNDKITTNYREKDGETIKNPLEKTGKSKEKIPFEDVSVYSFFND